MKAPESLRRLIERIAASDIFMRVAPRVIPPVDHALGKLTGGHVMLGQLIVPSILLGTTGARSGEARYTPLAAVPHGDDYYVVGSNFGGESHPGWSYNLLAHPRATVRIHGRTHSVQAHLLSAVEREAIWPELTRAWPPYDRFEERSGRDLRVFRLVAND